MVTCDKTPKSSKEICCPWSAVVYQLRPFTAHRFPELPIFLASRRARTQNKLTYVLYALKHATNEVPHVPHQCSIFHTPSKGLFCLKSRAAVQVVSAWVHTPVYRRSTTKIHTVEPDVRLIFTTDISHHIGLVCVL